MFAVTERLRLRAEVGKVGTDMCAQARAYAREGAEVRDMPTRRHASSTMPVSASASMKAYCLSTVQPSLR